MGIFPEMKTMGADNIPTATSVALYGLYGLSFVSCHAVAPQASDVLCGNWIGLLTFVRSHVRIQRVDVCALKNSNYIIDHAVHRRAKLHGHGSRAPGIGN